MIYDIKQVFTCPSILWKYFTILIVNLCTAVCDCIIIYKYIFAKIIDIMDVIALQIK